MMILAMIVNGMWWGLLFVGVPAAAFMAGFMHLGHKVARIGGMYFGAALGLALAASPLAFVLYGMAAALLSGASLIPQYRDQYQIYLLLGAGVAGLAMAALSFSMTRTRLAAGHSRQIAE